MSWFKKILSRNNEAKSSHLAEGMQKTRRSWGARLKGLLVGRKNLSQEVIDELEDCLLSADVGVEMTQSVIQPLVHHLERADLQNTARVFEVLKQQLIAQLTPHCVPIDFSVGQPFVMLVVGVNGAGKTTTIAKLARQLQLSGKKVMLAAGDTFRAAAVEQLQSWGKKYDIPVVAQKIGADSASVIYDAFQSAKAKGMDILIADTAGRLHTQTHLMDELKKIKRVLSKIDDTLPHEVMLVLDAGIGQNAMKQLIQFHEAIGLTGLVITKLDGTAKGGMVFSLSRACGLPFRYIGVGEGVDDLQPFDAEAFVEAIFYDDSV